MDPGSRDPLTALELDRNGRHFQTRFEYLDVADGFRAENGFVTRRDIRSGDFVSPVHFLARGRHGDFLGPLVLPFSGSGTTKERSSTRSTRRELELEFHRRTRHRYRGTTRTRCCGRRISRRSWRTCAFPQCVGRPGVPDELSPEVTFAVEIGAARPSTSRHPRRGPETADVEQSRPHADPQALERAHHRQHLSLHEPRPLRRTATRSSTITSSARSGTGSGRASFRSASSPSTTRSTRTRPRPSLRSSKNLNFDVARDLPREPGTALFAGYNGNGRSLDLLRPEWERPRLTVADDLTYDAWQVFLKLSYLFRF